MRGKSSCVESKLRDKAPHLLVIDRDICHHMHKSVKSFSKPFSKYVETFIDDVHTDMKWSSDIRDALKEICFMLAISYKLPPETISHRWLSLYDCCMTLRHTCDFVCILDSEGHEKHVCLSF